ncbi:MAG: uroporphyrinogen decarboxylase family protein [Anaerolineae bacterium]
MMRKLPLSDPQPDAEQFIDVLMGRATQKQPPLVEFLVDDVVMKPIVTEMLGRTWVDNLGDRETEKAYLDNMIEFWYRMGYDFIRLERDMGFPKNRLLAADTAPGSEKMRRWADQHQGIINSWEDFETYPWPEIQNVDFFPFEYISDRLPEEMGLIASNGGGVFERLSDLMSLEGLCLALYENPDLVKAVSDKLGELMTKFYEHLLDLDRLVAIFPGDDMGFKTTTLVSPAHLREYILPWHKGFAALTHQRGLPYFLHSCGNLEIIMEDLIAEVGIDGKHSFEDVIIPVDEFQTRYGDRIACLGGMDIHFLSTASPEQVRRQTRWLMDTCGAHGRYAIGSGNSIPSYIPVDNYLAMVDEACSI